MSPAGAASAAAASGAVTSLLASCCPSSDGAAVALWAVALWAVALWAVALWANALGVITASGATPARVASRTMRPGFMMIVPLGVLMVLDDGWVRSWRRDAGLPSQDHRIIRLETSNIAAQNTRFSVLLY
jgi:hypothetical protein